MRLRRTLAAEHGADALAGLLCVGWHPSRKSNQKEALEFSGDIAVNAVDRARSGCVGRIASTTNPFADAQIDRESLR
jgi:hypothetical protein